MATVFTKFQRSAQQLKQGGMMITMPPSSISNVRLQAEAVLAVDLRFIAFTAFA